MLYGILIILLVILILLFVLPGVIVFILIRTNMMKSSIFSQTFNTIMERMMSGINIPTNTDNHNVSHKEALEILGLTGEPTTLEINKAYHKLIQSNHPDKGGSSYLAQKINLARDLLLKKYK